MKKKIKDLVSGYCKQWNKNEAKKIIIPTEITYIILMFYYQNLQFNTKTHGTNLEFIGDKITHKISNTHIWSTCIFGDEITNQECKSFEIEIKWVTAIRTFFIGYIYKNQNIDWNVEPGCRKNKHNSVGIYLSHTGEILLCDKDNYDKDIRAEQQNGIYAKFKKNDLFRLKIDFEQNKFILYHNNNMIASYSLNGNKNIIPAFSFYEKGKIEVVRYSFS